MQILQRDITTEFRDHIPYSHLIDWDKFRQNAQRKFKEIEMKDFEKTFISVVNDYADDYNTDAVLDEFFPGQSIGEILLEMYNLGGIPEDVIEKFLDDEEVDESTDDWSNGI